MVWTLALRHRNCRKDKIPETAVAASSKQEASPLSQESPSLGTLMMAAYMTRYTLDTGLSLPC